VWSYQRSKTKLLLKLKNVISLNDAADNAAHLGVSQFIVDKRRKVKEATGAHFSARHLDCP
jgi:hypothetical protein